MNRYAHTIFEILCASYVYYHKNNNLMSDHEYDEKCKWLIKQKRQKLNNKLDKLIKWKSFKEKTSLYYIKEADYPEGLKRIAIKWLSLIQ